MSIDEYLQAYFNELREMRKEVAQLRAQIGNADPKLSYSINEAAKALGLSREAVYAKCKSGKIRYSSDGAGGAILIRRADLELYLSAGIGVFVGKENRNDVKEDETPVIKLNGAAGKVVRKYRRNHAD